MKLPKEKQDERQVEILNSWEGNGVSGERYVARVMKLDKIKQVRAHQWQQVMRAMVELIRSL